MDRRETHDLLDKALKVAAARITGDPACPARPGQVKLSHDILEAMLGDPTNGPGHVAGCAPTGVGKGLAGSMPAFLMAALNGQRTLVSTESKALQGQLIGQDYPLIASVVHDLTGEDIPFAVHKGFANYSCFAGNETFTTLDGPKSFREAVGPVTVLDGDGQWTAAEVRSFGEQEIVELTVQRFGQQRTIRTTAGHRWLLNPNANNPDYIERITSELRHGDKLAYAGIIPRLANMVLSPVGICAGLVFGDGTRFRSTDSGVHNGAARIQLHGPKMALAQHFEGIGTIGEPFSLPPYADQMLDVSNLPSFFKNAPDLRSNTSYLFSWLAGYFAADGTVSTDGQVSISSSKPENLRLVMAVCDHLGINHSGRMSEQRRVGYGTAESSLFKLHIASSSLPSEFFLKRTHRDRYTAKRDTYRRFKAARRWKVVSVRATGVVEEVFCAVVPTTHSFALTGNLLTGNCALAAEAIGSELAKMCGVDLSVKEPKPGRKKKVRNLASAEDIDETSVALLELLGDQVRNRPLRGEVIIDGRAFDGMPLARLAQWALTEAATGDSGDRADYPGEAPEQLWQQVSVKPDECIGAECPLYDMCPAQRARGQVSGAMIVVTNHTLLALQASLSVPVVISNRKLGMFDHLVVDEAHALPGIVRSTGARQVSGRRVGMLIKQLRDMMTSGTEVDRILGEGRDVASAIDMALGGYLLGKGDTAPYSCERHPLERVVNAVDSWVTYAKAILPDEEITTNMRTKIRIRRLNSGLTSLGEDLAESLDAEKHYARWVEADRDGSLSLRLSPVDVAPGIASNLFSSAQPESKEEKDERTRLGEDPPGRLALSVTMMSATLPVGFSRDVGVKARMVEYESPFDGAYGSSELYVPRVMDPAELDKIGSRNGSKWRFDTYRHPQWVVPQIVDLVRANGGRALVLAATGKGGQLYADALRAANTGHTIYSQWDGLDIRQVVSAWRADITSVLVGTRSMWTGVDAAGETCSLVIIDRAPRNPQNVVDDARAEILVNDQGLDKWTAERAVYVADAALLLEQACGRLIRSVNDSGLVAVLDPRMMKGTPISYAEGTRSAYMKALRRFVVRTGNEGAALEFLTGRRDLAA